MAFRLSIRRAMLLAGTLGTLAACPAAAQQQPAPGAAPAPAPAPRATAARLAADRPPEHRSRHEARAGRAAADSDDAPTNSRPCPAS